MPTIKLTHFLILIPPRNQRRISMPTIPMGAQQAVQAVHQGAVRRLRAHVDFLQNGTLINFVFAWASMGFHLATLPGAAVPICAGV
jgi:hypothetical protein